MTGECQGCARAVPGVWVLLCARAVPRVLLCAVSAAPCPGCPGEQFVLPTSPRAGTGIGSCSPAQGRGSHVQSEEKLFFTLIALELAEGDIMFYINFIIITVITEFMYTKEVAAP